jgi:DNA-binding MarR family transcriptional regulator
MPTTDGPRARPPRDAATRADATTIRVMDGLRRVVRALGSSARGRTTREGPSGAQLFALRQIADAGSLTIGELAARTLSRQSAVSEVVARLVARRLVARRPSRRDARRIELTLTAQGRRSLGGAAPTAQERLAEGLGRLPPRTRGALAAALEAWLREAGLAEVPATMFFEGGRRTRTAAPRRGRRTA